VHASDRGRLTRRGTATVVAALALLALFPVLARAQAPSIDPGWADGATVPVGPFPEGPYSSYEGVMPLTVTCNGSWSITIGQTWPEGTLGGVGGLTGVINSTSPRPAPAEKFQVSKEELPRTTTVYGGGTCYESGKPFQDMHFEVTVTFAEGVGPGAGQGGKDAPQSPSGGKGGKDTSRKRGILSEKSKQNLARAAQRLLGYANNAEAIANVCVLGGIKKAALKASLKAVAKDLAVSQIPIVNRIPTDPCSMALGAFTGIIRLEALGFVKLAQDPPRKRYRSRVKARVKVPISVRATKPSTLPLARTLSDAIKLNARAQGYLKAMLIANERMQGAQKARDGRWRKIHGRAARKFGKLARKAVIGVRKRGIKLARQLDALGYSQAPTADQLQQATSIGLSAPQDALLRVLGVGKRERKALAKDLRTATPPATTIAQGLRDGAASLATAAASLRAIK
jgi:hypothetical protein